MNGNYKMINCGEENTEEGEAMVVDASLITEFNTQEQRGFSSILLSPGSLVSLSRLVNRGKFKNIKVGGSVGGASAGKHLFELIEKKALGEVVKFRVPRNSSHVRSSVSSLK